MWQKLKSVFIVDEPNQATKAGKQSEAKTPAPATAPKKPPAKTGQVQSSGPRNIAVDSSGGQISDRFVKVLLEAMEKANQPSFDYLEYKRSLQHLLKMNFDEGTRYQTAYASAQSMGVTPEQLVHSASHYLNTLAQEEQKFLTALGDQQRKQVNKRGEQLKKLDEDIERLTKQLAEKQAKRQELNGKIKESTVRLSTTASDFEATYATIRQQIEADVAKMKDYLK